MEGRESRTAPPHRGWTWLIIAMMGGAALLSAPSAQAHPSRVDTPGPGSGMQPNGRQLRPSGDLVQLGNYPTGGAVTADGKFLWTVSAGMSTNDVRIVDTSKKKVCQKIDLPGASGGIALDSVHKLAYVSVLQNSRWQTGEERPSRGLR